MVGMWAKRMRQLRREGRRNNKIDRKDCIFWKLGTNKRQGSTCQDVLSLIRGLSALLSKHFTPKELNTWSHPMNPTVK